MTTTRLPERLPFYDPERIGLPYHGLVTGIRATAKLELPDESDMTYRQSLNGDAVAVSGHAAATTQEVVDGNFRWRNYALLSGNDRRIGQKALGAYGWIYNDGANNWRVSLEFSQPAGSNQITVSVYLEDLFGRFSLPVVACTRRLLDSLTFVPKLYNGTSAPAPAVGVGQNYYAMGRTLTHSRDGSVSVINFAGLDYWFATGVVRYTVGAFDAQEPCNTDNEYFDKITAGATVSGTYGYHTAIEIDIGGTGSVAAGSVGDGIVATVSALKTADQMITEQSVELTNYSYTEISESEGKLEYEVECSLSGSFAVDFLQLVTSAGAVVPVSFEETYLRDYYAYRNDIVIDKDITESQFVRGYTLTAPNFSVTATHDVSSYVNEETDEDTTAILEDGSAVAVLSTPAWSVVCDRCSTSSATDVTPEFSFDMIADGGHKTYSGLLYWSRAIASTDSDTNRKSMLVYGVDGTTEIIDKPAGWSRLWNYSALSGKNCSYNPASGDFWYDLTVAPNYVGSCSSTITDLNNETAGSYV